MKKILIYMLLLGAAVLMPIQGEDVGKLLPVEVVGIYKTEDTVVLVTDVEATGEGDTVEAAIKNMKATTSGIIFLDTADYLLIDETAKEEAVALSEYLKPAVRVAVTEGSIDLKEAASFLSVHKPETKMKAYQHTGKTDILAEENGKLILKEN